ncbi:MAG: hypothetical protein Q4A54_08050 [Parabacteroides sp.]|nr:hypothetical protein [Parabacteroides sp.]
MTQLRIPDSLFKRNTRKEKSYGIDCINLRGYKESDSEIYILGELISQTVPKHDFTVVCSIYDSDGDIMKTTECSSYGSGLVTSMIRAKSFFSGFPFTFSIYGIKVKEIAEIRITLEKDY